MESFEHRREQTLRSESAFAFSYLSKVLPNDGRILEVGGGAGFLASLLQQSGRQIDVFEPISSGFESSKRLQVSNLNWLETLPPSGQYDAIIANHVIEHIPEWETVIEEWVDLLAPGGSLFLLFPNYAFPYEPHFGVPYLYSKKLTWRCFSKKILAMRPNSRQMYEELSMPRARVVLQHMKSLGLESEVDRDYTLSYLGRGSDKAFLDRKGWLLRTVLGAMRRPFELILKIAPKILLPVVAISGSKREATGNL